MSAFDDFLVLLQRLLGLLPPKAEDPKPKPLVTPADLGWDEEPTKTEARKPN
jgi:hypothetical protein